MSVVPAFLSGSCPFFAPWLGSSSRQLKIPKILLGPPTSFLSLLVAPTLSFLFGFVFFFFFAFGNEEALFPNMEKTRQEFTPPSSPLSFFPGDFKLSPVILALWVLFFSLSLFQKHLHMVMVPAFPSSLGNFFFASLGVGTSP